MLDGLKDSYLEMEGWIEERMGDMPEDIAGWRVLMGAVLGDA